MTKLDNEEVLNIPDIVEAEDTPFPSQQDNLQQNSIDINLGKNESIDDELMRFKYKTGKKVLYIAMGAMGVLVLVELFANCYKIESTLITSSFEAFKLIAMTAIGYILGTNVSK